MLERVLSAGSCKEKNCCVFWHNYDDKHSETEVVIQGEESPVFQHKVLIVICRKLTENKAATVLADHVRFRSGWRLDLMILKVSSNLSDPVIEAGALEDVLAGQWVQ